MNRTLSSRHGIKLLLIKIATVFVSLLPGIATAGWVITDLGAQGALFNEVIAMNNQGEILGQAMAPNPVDPASERLTPFIWRPRSGMQEISTPSGSGLIAFALNDRGEVVGTCQFSCSEPAEYNGFVWNDGSVQFFRGGGGSHTNAAAYGINNLGQVAGTGKMDSFDDTGNYTGSPSTAIVWGLTSFPANGAEVSAAWAVNDSGQVIGSRAPIDSSNSDVFRGSLTGQFFWQQSTGEIPLTALCGQDFVVQTPTPGPSPINNAGFILGRTPRGSAVCDPGVGTYLVGFPSVALNDINEVVGTSGGDVLLRSTFGTLLDLTELTDAASLGWTNMFVVDLNDERQILGYGLHNGLSTVFLIERTVPEPATLALLGLALAGMGLARRCRLD